MTFRFANPMLLWLLLALPLLAMARGRVGRGAALLYPSADLLHSVARRILPSAGRAQLFLRLLALGLAIVALARPQQGLGIAEVETSGIDIVLAIDVSGSMRALDFELDGETADRLQVVKSVVRRFIEGRPDDRLGLVAFAGRPYLVSPLTLDHDWLLQNLERVQIGLIEDGTAVGSAIAASVNRLREQKAKSKVVILLTDGVNNSGKVSPLTAADAARALGVKVYTIAAGTQGEAPMPVTDRFGNERVVMAPVEVDEETLRKVAETTDAAFFRATDTATLERIYAQIDELEKTTATVKRYEEYRELYRWPLAACALLLLLEIVLAETKLRRLP
ncbi:MAG TPA: VWA domain-containing protein [Candidatus Binatia bacterium]